MSMQPRPCLSPAEVAEEQNPAGERRTTRTTLSGQGVCHESQLALQADGKEQEIWQIDYHYK